MGPKRITKYMQIDNMAFLSNVAMVTPSCQKPGKLNIYYSCKSGVFLHKVSITKLHIGEQAACTNIIYSFLSWCTGNIPLMYKCT